MSDSSALVLALFVLSSLMLFLSAYAMAQRRFRSAPEFACLMGASAIYALSYGLELTRTTVESMLAVIRFEYVAIAVLPAFWLLFALAFTGRRRPHPLVVAALFLIPLVTIVAVWTNGNHHLYYARTWTETNGPFPVFGFKRGPLYWLNTFYLQLCIFVGNIIFIVHALRSPRLVRHQAAISALGSLGPWLGNTCYQLGWIPWGLDPSPFFLVFSGFCFSLALFRLGFFELVPVARDRAIESLRDGFLVIDGRGHLIDANEAAGRLLGDWARQKGESLDEGGPGSAEIREVIARGEAEIEFGIAVPGGERRLVAQCFPVREGRRSKMEGCAVMIRDVTENAALLVRLAQLAGTDELTGLYNRRRFFKLASREFSIAVRDGRDLAVAILDIDHFKNVNDRFGHAAGDAALRCFSSRLSGALREADILCRYGGEEFAVIFPGADPQAAFFAVERIRLAACEEPIVWEGGAFGIRSSAGVYSAIPNRESSIDAFLEEADQALYEAKRGGRDRSVSRAAAAGSP
jgi:diguanylate cyclase (GGDEF)-like protein